MTVFDELIDLVDDIIADVATGKMPGVVQGQQSNDHRQKVLTDAIEARELALRLRDKVRSIYFFTPECGADFEEERCTGCDDYSYCKRWTDADRLIQVHIERYQELAESGLDR